MAERNPNTKVLLSVMITVILAWAAWATTTTMTHETHIAIAETKITTVEKNIEEIKHSSSRIEDKLNKVLRGRR